MRPELLHSKERSEGLQAGGEPKGLHPKAPVAQPKELVLLQGPQNQPHAIPVFKPVNGWGLVEGPVIGRPGIPASPMKRVDLDVCEINQGDTNGCGTTSLAMSLNCLSNRCGRGTPYTREQLDFNNRELDCFSSPLMLCREARRRGYHAEAYNNMSFDEVRYHLDRNHPVMALIQAGENSLHYVVIRGYEVDPAHPNDLSRARYHISDPATGSSRWQSVDSFHQEWQNLRFRGYNTHLNQFGIVLSDKPDLPPSRSIPWTVYAADIVNRLVNVAGRIKRGFEQVKNVAVSVAKRIGRFFRSLF